MFRANEAEAKGFEEAKSRLIPRGADMSERVEAERVLQDIVDMCGPVVEAYPSWHPLMTKQNQQNSLRQPSERSGYKGLDHTTFFVHGFITCPYTDGTDVINSAHEIDTPHCAHIEAKRLDTILYNAGTSAILVRCVWDDPLEVGHLIPKNLAIPLMLEQQVPVWRWSEVGESWDNMKPYLLGAPHGARSSLFVGQDTALAMKKIYISMIESGMFGPVMYA